MAEVDVRERLAALLGHLNQHPHLDVTMSGIHVPFGKLHLQPFPFDSEGIEGLHLGVLAVWARTLTEASLRVQSLGSNDLTPHVYLSGLLASGAPVSIVAVLPPEEADLLSSAIPLREGETFSVEVLLGLVDTPAESGAVTQ